MPPSRRCDSQTPSSARVIHMIMVEVGRYLLLRRMREILPFETTKQLKLVEIS